MASGTLDSTVSTYNFSLEALKELIAADLDVDAEDLQVEYIIQEVGGDPLGSYNGRNQVTKVRVTLKHDVTS